jgi:hypothetical protein
MQVTVQEQIKHNPALNAAVEQATKLLEHITRRVKDWNVAAEWRSSPEERNSSLVELQLTYDDESTAARFTPKELADGDRMEMQLRHLWDALLAAYMDKHLEKLHRLVQQLEEGD